MELYGYKVPKMAALLVWVVIWEIIGQFELARDPVTGGSPEPVAWGTEPPRPSARPVRATARERNA